MDHSWGYGSEQRLREKNEDCYGVFDFPEYTLALVCDGMGGHVGGAYASALAVRTIHDAMRDAGHEAAATAIERAIQRTNVAIYEAARKNHRLMGMGTTVVAAVITRDTCVLAHVGDSRAYLIRRGNARALTRDHTMVNLFVDAELLSPEDAATHPEAHVLSRSLGVERNVEVDVSEPISLEPGDVIMLCSDGVHGVALERELAMLDWSAPHEAVHEILRIVVARAGDDNATAVAVMMGTSVEDVPATPLPDTRRIDDGPVGGVGRTAVPEAEYDPPSPAPMDTQPVTNPFEADTHDVAEFAPIAVPEPRRPSQPGAPSRPPPLEPPRPPPVPSWNGPSSLQIPTETPGPEWEPEPDISMMEARRTPPGRPVRTKANAGRRYLVPLLAATFGLLGVVVCGFVTLVIAGDEIQALLASPSSGTSAEPAPEAGMAAAPPPPIEIADTCADWTTARAIEDPESALAAMRAAIDGCDQTSVLDPALLDYLDLARRRMLALGHGIVEPPQDADESGQIATLDGKRVAVFGLSPDRVRFVEAVDAVLSHTFAPPTGPNAPDLARTVADQRPRLLLETGSLLCLHHRFADALPRLQELATKYPGSPESERAESLMIDCRRPPNDRDGDGVKDDQDLCPAIADAEQRDSDQDGVGDACEDDHMVCPSGDWLVQFEPLPPKGRLPRSAQECTQPPPGGAEQMRAIQYARAGQCALSLNEVQAAMKISPDHCSLYKMAWPCFRGENVEPLLERDQPVRTWDDLVLLLPHFYGARSEHDAQIAANARLALRPDWARPATSGIEFRLEAWEYDPVMQRYLSDLLGEPQVADDLGRDLFLEAQVAVALACSDPATRSPVMENAWARRVYVLARALSGPSGAIIAQHRDDLTPRLRSALALATSARIGPDGKAIPVPAIVREAYDVGTGNKKLELTEKARPRPNIILEPIIIEDRGVDVHGGGRKNKAPGADM